MWVFKPSLDYLQTNGLPTESAVTCIVRKMLLGLRSGSFNKMLNNNGDAHPFNQIQIQLTPTFHCHHHLHVLKEVFQVHLWFKDPTYSTCVPWLQFRPYKLFCFPWHLEPCTTSFPHYFVFWSINIVSSILFHLFWFKLKIVWYNFFPLVPVVSWSINHCSYDTRRAFRFPNSKLHNLLVLLWWGGNTTNKISCLGMVQDCI